MSNNKDFIVSNTFALFVNLDYAHKPQAECAQIWQSILDTMLGNGFLFRKRAFVISTEKTRDEIAMDVRHLFDEIQSRQANFYSYIIDCFILNYENCNDLTFPDTSDSIQVEDISLEDLNKIGVDYDLLFKNK